MNLKIIAALLIFLWVPTLLVCQTNNEPGSYSTILFKITNPASDKISYLFGTHHALGKPFFDSLSQANQALTSSDLLIKENLNIPGEMPEDLINRRTKVTPWEKYLGKEDLMFIRDLFAKSPTDFNKLTPPEMYAFLNRYFKQRICLVKSAYDTSATLDDYIGAKAGQLNLELVGLETSADQIELINNDVQGMPRKVHKRRLSNIIEKLRSKRTSDCEETDWYRKMDIDYLLNEPCRNTLILTDRNEKWMKTIRELIENNNCFIVVGLSHLMYDCGLIRELQRIGYDVEPLDPK